MWRINAQYVKANSWAMHQISVPIVVPEWRLTLMINIIGSFVAFMGAMIFGWMGNLTMTIAMLAGVIYFKE